jgi:hypothetical protein
MKVRKMKDCKNAHEIQPYAWLSGLESLAIVRPNSLQSLATAHKGRFPHPD